MSSKAALPRAFLKNLLEYNQEFVVY